jgi:hypothetical protein
MSDFTEREFALEAQEKIYWQNALKVLTHPNARRLVERMTGAGNT